MNRKNIKGTIYRILENIFTLNLLWCNEKKQPTQSKVVHSMTMSILPYRKQPILRQHVHTIAYRLVVWLYPHHIIADIFPLSIAFTMRQSSSAFCFQILLKRQVTTKGNKKKKNERKDEDCSFFILESKSSHGESMALTAETNTCLTQNKHLRFVKNMKQKKK